MKNAKKGLKYRMALLKLGMSQRELAKELNFSESYISMLILGSRKNKKFSEYIFAKLQDKQSKVAY